MLPGSISAGLNTVVLSTPIGFLFTPTFCVGVYSGPMNDAIRMATETPGDGRDSFIRAPVCGFNSFATLHSIGAGDRKFCIEALVSGN